MVFHAGNGVGIFAVDALAEKAARRLGPATRFCPVVRGLGRSGLPPILRRKIEVAELRDAAVCPARGAGGSEFAAALAADRGRWRIGNLSHRRGLLPEVRGATPASSVGAGVCRAAAGRLGGGAVSHLSLRAAVLPPATR